MAYTPIDFKNLPSTATPLSAANMNHIQRQYEESVIYTDTAISNISPTPSPAEGGSEVDPRWLPILTSGRKLAVFLGSSTTNRGGFVNAFKGNIWNRWRTGKNIRLSVASPSALETDGIHSVNAGIGNTTTDNYLPAANLALINSLNPSVVFHTIGSNDWYYGRSPALFAASLENAIQSITSNTPILHVLVHQHERADLPHSPYTWQEYGEAMSQVAVSAGNRLFVNASPGMTSLGVGEGLGNEYGLLDSDNIHLTPSGELVLGSLVASKLSLAGGFNTGWVNLDYTLSEGWSFASGGRVVAKRSGDVVTFKVDGVQGPFNTSGGTSNFLENIPQIFRPDVRAWGSSWGSTGTRPGVAVIREAGTFGVVHSTAPAQIQATVTFVV